MRDVRDLADEFLNSNDRSTGHVVLGVGLMVGAALMAASVAARAARPSRDPLPSGARATIERPKSPLSVALPALFSATTLSAIRIWNAPQGPTRTSALAYWGVAQAVNALWLAVRPRNMVGQMLAAMTSAGVTAAYAHEARKLDRRAGVIAAPQGRGVGLVNIVGDRLKHLRASPPTATLH